MSGSQAFFDAQMLLDNKFPSRLPSKLPIQNPLVFTSKRTLRKRRKRDHLNLASKQRGVDILNQVFDMQMIGKRFVISERK